MKVFVLTHFPSPYQVEFFNEIASRRVCELEVAYLRQRDSRRYWSRSALGHEAIELDRKGRLDRARQAVRKADLVVFNYYWHSNAGTLVSERTASGGPWCFWGERPGFRQPAWMGRLVRKWKLARLHASPVPIWGIGKFAVDGYRREFGSARVYFNLPYFSNLERFRAATSHKQTSERRTFLFAGSLIKRKGIDLLARAFVRLAHELPNVSLKIAGDGEMKKELARIVGPAGDRVELVGFKDWAELPELYSSADVLCAPSKYDGWGLVVPEGLASGLPVIATDRMGAALEFVRKERNGWLIPAGDEEAILNALREAALLPKNELVALAHRARQSVSEHTLQHGVSRFARYAKAAVAGWQG